jgi:hypothetical protein
MRVEFTFGIGFDRTNEPIPEKFARNATKQILIEASNVFGGCNLIAGQGSWIDVAGNLVLEESRTLVVDLISANRFGSEFGADDNVKIATLAEYIRSSLNQAAVHVTKLVATSRDTYIHKA